MGGTMPSAEYEEMKELLGGEPSLLKTMEEKGVFKLYYPLFKYNLAPDTDGKIPELIEKGISSVLATKCSRDYCFIGHALHLSKSGISSRELEDIVQQLKFPSRIPDSEKWSKVLKWAFLFGNTSNGNPAETQEVDNTIKNLLTNDELSHLYNIIISSAVITRFSEFYFDTVSWEKDIPPGEQGEQIKMLIPDLVSFYHKISASDNQKRPVVTMCMHCKDIRDSSGKWRALETSLSALDRNSMFSHSICDSCHEKYHTTAA